MKRPPIVCILALLFSACDTAGESAADPEIKLGYEELFEDDIEEALAVIEQAAEPGRYEAMEALIEASRAHPSQRVRHAAGAAIETVCSESFGLGDPNERRRIQALGKAMQWWTQRKPSLLLQLLVDRIRPQLSMVEDYAASEPARMYLQTGFANPDLPASLIAVEWLKVESRGLEPQLATALSREDLPALMRERMALAIGGGLSTGASVDFARLVCDASDPLVRCAIYVHWARLDLGPAVASMRQRILEASNPEEREALIQTAWSFDREGVEEHFKGRLEQDDIELWEIGLLGQMGFDSLRPRVIHWALSRDMDDTERQVFLEASKSLGLHETAVQTLEAAFPATDSNEWSAPHAQKAIAVVIHGLEEEELIGLLPNELLREMAAKALGDMGSKSAVPPLIDRLDDPDMTAASLEALEVITGRDFSSVDESEIKRFLEHEEGDPAVLRARFLKNRAKLWWSECADFSRSQWLKMALNDAGFNKLRKDGHAMGERESKLLDRLVQAAPLEAPAVFKTLMDTGQDVNIDYVVRAVMAKRSPSWADAIMPWVDRPLDMNSRRIALAFCAAAGPTHHRQLHALLRSQHPDVSRAAADALARWGGFRSVESLIKTVEYGSEEEALLAQEILSSISHIPAIPILGYTKPQRKPAVKRWTTWWRSVADDSQPGAWQKKEVERLLGELIGEASNFRIWDRLEILTGLPTQGQTKDGWRELWRRSSHPLWTLHGKDIVDLAGSNFHRFLLARERMLSGGTRDDVRQMAVMAPNTHKAFKSVIRRLTGVDPNDRKSWEAALAMPEFPMEVRLEEFR